MEDLILPTKKAVFDEANKFDENIEDIKFNFKDVSETNPELVSDNPIEESDGIESIEFQTPLNNTMKTLQNLKQSINQPTSSEDITKLSAMLNRNKKKNDKVNDKNHTFVKPDYNLTDSNDEESDDYLDTIEQPFIVNVVTLGDYYIISSDELEKLQDFLPKLNIDSSKTLKSTQQLSEFLEEKQILLDEKDDLDTTRPGNNHQIVQKDRDDYFETIKTNSKENNSSSIEEYKSERETGINNFNLENKKEQKNISHEINKNIEDYFNRQTPFVQDRDYLNDEWIEQWGSNNGMNFYLEFICGYYIKVNLATIRSLKNISIILNRSRHDKNCVCKKEIYRKVVEIF